MRGNVAQTTQENPTLQSESEVKEHLCIEQGVVTGGLLRSLLPANGAVCAAGQRSQ